ncbi:glycosyltransferase family 2 protein [Rhodococcoides fascians]|uniref:glycosyltransferase family 2 protein n=1 Tax=Rhodococcoides fascians TaxID=1828 RepID=UPI002ACD94F0|nr:glycosyltransferase family 2 protein [Rhodococcus fascians]WQH27767.1 glycosyltransferase family 2 protein [Rhodococcus fascians]
MTSSADSGVDRVVAVVVHHKSYESIGSTVALLVADGIDTNRVVVVDNGEELERRAELALLLPDGVHLLFEENRGYGAAVNRGVEYADSLGAPYEFVLVSTHECRVQRGAVATLVAALDRTPDAAIVGPTLTSGQADEFIWSAGGLLTPILRLPRHYFHRAAELPSLASAEVDREWLDGAFLVTRRAALRDRAVDERFFMYMEEVDHHVALRSRGWRILWVPTARVWQSSGGIPPYYLGRNMQLFQRWNGTRFSRVAATPWSIAHRALSDVRHRKGLSNVSAMIRGWNDARRVRDSSGGSVVIVNPLGGALAHYERELTDVIHTGGLGTTTLSTFEPSHAGGSRVGWLLAYLRLLIQSRSTKNRHATVVVWPALGYLDAVVVRVLAGSKAFVVMHDPSPLVRSVGYDAVSTRLAKMFGGDRFIVHSEAARKVTTSSSIDTTVLPHPLLAPVRHSGEPSDRRVVRVLGQYKTDRDLLALEEIAASIGDEDVDLQILGRGWPAVKGWTVTDVFLSEQDFDAAVDSASLVVIPYRKFFQSGVAIRCFERGTPIVGVGGTSLDELVGNERKLLVGPSYSSTWSGAVKYGLSREHLSSPSETDAVRAASVDGWNRWLRSVS